MPRKSAPPRNVPFEPLAGLFAFVEAVDREYLPPAKVRSWPRGDGVTLRAVYRHPDGDTMSVTVKVRVRRG